MLNVSLTRQLQKIGLSLFLYLRDNGHVGDILMADEESL